MTDSGVNLMMIASVQNDYFVGIPLIYGLIASILHVISGPDHLAAVSPLAIENKLKAWLVGLGWGIGHTAGMLVVGMLFILFKDFIPVELISTSSESIVGFVLLIIGFWALWRIFGKTPKHKHLHPHTHANDHGISFTHIHTHNHPAVNIHRHEHKKAVNQSFISASIIGLIHGMAGFSHLLGVLPTLAFKTISESAYYLIGFGVGTIISMVVFSVVLGFVAFKTDNSKRPFLFRTVQLTGAMASILIGIYWISTSF
jgi:ABC-type nickel/cobalt efflux system permease component RcnA